MKQYKKYVIPYKSAFILGPIFMIVEVLGEIILPKLMSMIINYGCGQDVTVAAKGPAYIIGIGAAMIGTALLMMMGGVLGAYFAVKASVNFAGDLRRDVFAKVQKFSFANIEKFSTYFGMPEYDSLNSDGNLRDELTSIAYEQLVNSLINFDTDKCQARYSKNITSGILSYLQLENKHTLAKAKIEMASSLYPRITSYYQELLILAHKGGSACRSLRA